MSYRDMTRLACWVAQAGMDEFKRDDIESMCEKVGFEAARDFYTMYDRIYGAECDHILTWIDELEEEWNE